MSTNMGGRPKKGPAEKLKYRVSVKLCTEDYYSLKARAREAGVNATEFARQAILSGRVVARLTPEQVANIRTLCGMGNNLNQIAKKANAAGYIAARSEYLSLAPNIDELLNRLLYDR